jgi:hypothetical protein
MDATAHELAQQIANQAVLANFKFWLAFGCLNIAIAFVCGALTGYATKRGQNLATKADFQELLNQTKRTTTEVEAIRSDISLGEWTEKEYRSLRRVKLEELIFAAYEGTYWVKNVNNELLYQTIDDDKLPETSQSPMVKACVVSGLYFPELREAVGLVEAAHDRYLKWTQLCRIRISEAKINALRKAGDGLHVHHAKMAVYEEINSELEQYYSPLLIALRALEANAYALMNNVTAPVVKRPGTNAA